MNFSQSISSCMSKYVTFSGRATRSEFWWFYLFCVLLSWGAIIVGEALQPGSGSIFSSIINLVLLLPVLSAGSRRLHDIGKSGWWQLIMLTGIGLVLLIIWWATNTKQEETV